MIRNASLAVAIRRRAPYLLAPNDTESSRVSGKKTYVSLKPEYQSGGEPVISDPPGGQL